MAERYHLGTDERPEGALWYSLVVENPMYFYVEIYNDTPLSFLRDRVKIIHLIELSKHALDGVPLTKLVADKFRQLNFQSGPEEKPKTKIADERNIL